MDRPLNKQMNEQIGACMCEWMRGWMIEQTGENRRRRNKQRCDMKNRWQVRHELTERGRKVGTEGGREGIRTATHAQETR